jgi:hypothetical protein
MEAIILRVAVAYLSWRISLAKESSLMKVTLCIIALVGWVVYSCETCSGAQQPKVDKSGKPSTGLYVRTTPGGANVTLSTGTEGNSRRLNQGKSPCLLELTPGVGEIVVELEKDGYDRETKSVKIRDGRITRRHYELTKVFKESFDDGYPCDKELKTHTDWFSESGGSVKVVSGCGVGNSAGLTAGDKIVTWSAHPFYWKRSTLESVMIQMDFQASPEGKLNDDRIGWMISNTDVDSSNMFGVQVDRKDHRNVIEGYWDGKNKTNVREEIVTLPTLKPGGWYRLRAEIHKLQPQAARIDVSFWSLDSSGSPEEPPVARGTIDDTSKLGEDAPDDRYFEAEIMWPGFKNFSTEDGAADNAQFNLQ